MSVQDCAEAVQRGDPDRFAATMTLPVDRRAVLFALYAFNLEIARAPWVSEEPMIARMRLQWWQDALDEVFGQGAVRRHFVLDVLAPEAHSRPALRAPLERMIAGRVREVEAFPCEDWTAFETYLDETSGGLVEAAYRLSDVTAPPLEVGRAMGFARLLEAVPELEARGALPLATLADTSQVAERALSYLEGFVVPKDARDIMRMGWLTRSILKRAAQARGTEDLQALRPSPVRAKALLIWAGLTGWF